MRSRSKPGFGIWQGNADKKDGKRGGPLDLGMHSGLQNTLQGVSLGGNVKSYRKHPKARGKRPVVEKNR